MTISPQATFDRLTQVHADGQSRYSTVLDPDWHGPFERPIGGIIAAVLLRAAQCELAQPELLPRSVNAHFLRPTSSDPAQLTVEVLRVGRRNATAQVAMLQGEKLTSTALITFSAPRPQTLTIKEPAPSAPAPDQSEELRAHLLDEAPPYLRHLRVRPCFGAPLFSGAPDAVTGGWVDLREDAEDQLYDSVRLVALTDLWWPAIYAATSQVVGTPSLELTVHLRTTTPVPGPILARFVTRTIQEGHLEETGQLWSRSGQLLAESRQFALLIEPSQATQG
jgi:acyl-CoA thioesterase